MGSGRSVLVWLATVFLSYPVAAQAPLPQGWPDRLELGMMDGPGGSAAMRATTGFAFRYQYLAGGVNTNRGWATWNHNGEFVRYYVEDSRAHGFIPVFTYYMMFHSLPGGGSEGDANFTNVNNVSTMTAYYNDLILLFQKAGAFPQQRVVLHVEPDFWGYMQKRTASDDARSVPAKVSETGIPQLAGLPSTVSGFAQAIARFRDEYAPNVILGYHLSVWGTNVDITLQDPSDPAWSKQFSTWLSANESVELLMSPTTGEVSSPDESERDFRGRLQHKGREVRDEEVERLRKEYAPKEAALK
ncbi:MAG: hypothetical protein FJW27_05775 [Acidimicrobiia bacterium]|nr:hypothetical protein [Acidimicrobiia bacterium]